MDTLLIDKPSKIVRAYFIALNTTGLVLPSSGGASGPPPWSCFTNTLPDTPDSAVVIGDTAGTLHGKLMRTGEQMLHFGIQVRVRALDDDVAYQKVVLLMENLNKIKMTTVTLGSNQYVIRCAARTSQPVFMGVDKDDQKRRTNYTVNTLMKIAPKT